MELFRERLLARLVERHAISEDLARKLVAWRHPGFPGSRPPGRGPGPTPPRARVHGVAGRAYPLDAAVAPDPVSGGILARIIQQGR